MPPGGHKKEVSNAFYKEACGLLLKRGNCMDYRSLVWDPWDPSWTSNPIVWVPWGPSYGTPRMGLSTVVSDPSPPSLFK